MVGSCGVRGMCVKVPCECRESSKGERGGRPGNERVPAVEVDFSLKSMYKQ